MAECGMMHVKNLAMFTLNILTERHEQTVQTQIKLLLQEQFDQGLHCLPFNQQFLDTLPDSQMICSVFR